jgi:hypothetical protein
MDLKITTDIRGRTRTLLWQDGQLRGDQELLDRVLRTAAGAGIDLATADELDVLHACRDATPAPLQIEPLDVDIPDHALDLRATAPVVVERPAPGLFSDR